MSTLYHHDQQLENRAERVIHAQLSGMYLLQNQGEHLGLPQLDHVKNMRYERTETGFAYVCPEGKAVYVPELTLYRFIPHNGKMPEGIKFERLQIAAAHLDVAHKRALIQHNGTTITLEDVDTWRNGYDLCREINHELHHGLHLPLVITKITYEGKPDPAAAPLFGGHKVKFASDHVIAPLTGFALDKELDDRGIPRLVYAGAVGYKTLLESVRATLQANRKQKKVVRIGNTTCFAHPDPYQTFYTPLPNVNAMHLACVVQSALPGRWQYGDIFAYLLQFEGDPTPLSHKLVDKLTEATTLPMLKEWADVLWDTASDDPNLVVELQTDGDCLAGYWISLNQELWATLIQTLLSNSTLSL